MSRGPQLHPAIGEAREQLSEGREKLRQQHDAGSPGVQVCARLTKLLDDVVLQLHETARITAAEEIGGDLPVYSLVAHGGYGRRDIAPYSDVDLMLLHEGEREEDLTPLARLLSQHIVDAGLALGFSTRSITEACRLPFQDGKIFSSLVESRLLEGDEELFERFFTRFRRSCRSRSRSLISAIEQERKEERNKYGETVFLLRPNIKRSRGGLRDMHFLRWVGFARYGEAEPVKLCQAGVLSIEERRDLQNAREFLLRLRNELHFHAMKSQDVLEKTEQIRLAEKYAYAGSDAMLPVEQFMREYFEHSSNIRYIVSNFVEQARRRSTVDGLFVPLITHQVEGDFRVGPVHIRATRRGKKKLSEDLYEVLRLMDLANLYNKRIAHDTWQTIRHAMTTRQNVTLTDEARDRFMSIMEQPAQLGEVLRRLHQLRVLEKIIPAVAHARCLLQFNDYHKYTVDEHSFRAVEYATQLIDEPGPLGEAYRRIKQKRTLHLALLLHDLGKGFVEDHSEVGLRIAEETAELMQLSDRHTEKLKLLVHKHLMMAHLAFRRDIADESVVVQLAVTVGSPDTLRMLYVLTAADLAAVGPGVLNDWKLNLLTQLFERALPHLEGDGPTPSSSAHVDSLRDEIRELVKDDEANRQWWSVQIPLLPRSYLLNNPPGNIAEELGKLIDLRSDDAVASGRFLPERDAVEYTVCTYEQITPGVFHKLTGALASKRQQVLSAEISTLADSLILDRFYVSDMDFQGEPPPERMDEVCRAIVKALKKTSDSPPKFQRVWTSSHAEDEAEISRNPARVHIDNQSADSYSIVDVFAHDSIGLLYTITRKLFELDLSIGFAKIGTYLDQVVDVFYVTDLDGAMIIDEDRISEIQSCILEAIHDFEAR
jgi:[protein-PII] uridylyltransferase